MADLRLQVILTALDKVTAPLKKIRDDAAPTSRALKATSDRLKELNAQQKSLNQFRELHQGLSTTTNKLNAAQASVSRLARELNATAAPTRAMTREFNAAVKVARSLKTEHRNQNQQLQVLRDRLSSAGISTNALGKAQSWLKNSISLTNAELSAQQARLSAAAAQQHRFTSANQQADRLRGVAGKMAMTGAGAMMGGRVAIEPLMSGLHEARHYQTEMARVTSLGLGAETSARAVEFARHMQTYGTSHLDNLELLRDGMTVFGDLHHAELVAPTLAKMKFGNKAFYGDEKGGDNERKFMDMLKVIEERGGLASPELFDAQANKVQRVITVTGGRVGPTEWLNLIKTGGVAVRGMNDEAFYYQMEPLVQMLSGYRVGHAVQSAYNNLYQGRTTKRAAINLEKFGLIGDRSKVKYDKVGQTSQLDPGALLGSDLFRFSQFDWMEQVLLPQLARHGMTKKGQILDAMGSLFSDRTASSLFTDMYLQRNRIRKNQQLNKGAYDIDQINTLAKAQLAGQELETSARLADLKLALGEKILPMYTDAIVRLTGAIKQLNGFMEANPALSKAVIVALGVIAAIAVTVGGGLLVLSPIIAAYALLSVSLARLSTTGGILLPVVRVLGATIMWLGRIFMAAGVTFLANPIGLTITAIAVAALLIYQYWAPITTFFVELWAGITALFNRSREAICTTADDAWTWMKASFNDGMTWFATLSGRFAELGSNIMMGLANGITNALGWVKNAITGAGESVIGWFKDKLGIHSPSRVFAALGDYTMQGFTVGLQRSENAPLSQVTGLARRLTQLAAGITITAATMPSMAFDTRVPLSARSAAPTAMQGDTIQIVINPAAGMNEQAIASEVARILENRDRQKAAQRRSSLSDY